MSAVTTSSTNVPATSAATALSSNTGDMPSIRLVPHVDHSGRHSLQFEPIERSVNDKTIIKVGRFTDKQNSVCETLITFKSKVVSRSHAHIWCEGGQWFVKDIKSSSGTFLNHIRLSPPNTESRPFPLKDGDVLQLGIDFRGGTEEVYRCVKARVEVNKSWQRTLNQFDVAAHKHIRNLAAGKPIADSDNASLNSSECCICLFPIAPCQALFVAPCSHVWHFKCIRPMLIQAHPNFLCPLCRQYADLEATVEKELDEVWADVIKSSDPKTPKGEIPEPLMQPIAAAIGSQNPTSGLTQAIDSMNAEEAEDTQITEPTDSATAAINMSDDVASGSGGSDNDSLSAIMGAVPIPVNRRLRALTENGVDGNTPRIDSGPFVFDETSARQDGNSVVTSDVAQAQGGNQA
ncbi:hypothetical protein SAICODRAFT_53519 [Saitoella complicata NRRL Y-17804]|nr:uncharacterized protein SAICODRAFT_53519 [Saitoella complicata NRRL Y-17804]ODQ55086.1 hypothetical protein SAICODRAFT_53519 [Saitoella complicata NRRL Y-17804]